MVDRTHFDETQQQLDERIARARARLIWLENLYEATEYDEGNNETVSVSRLQPNM